MYRVQYASLITLAMAWLVAAPLQAALSKAPGEASVPQPGKDLLPQDVVSIVINALANNDNPFSDAGIATTFAFASPANKLITGPLGKFTQMVKNDVYGIMVDHVESRFSEVVHDGHSAYQLVLIEGRNGVEGAFAFRLSKQLDGEFKDMWMTDAVWPVASGAVPERAF